MAPPIYSSFKKNVSVADPGFDIRGGMDFVNGGGGENH